MAVRTSNIVALYVIFRFRFGDVQQ